VGELDDLVFYHGGTSARSEIMRMSYAGNSTLAGNLSVSGEVLIGTTALPSAAGALLTVSGASAAYTQYNKATAGGGVVGTEGTGLVFYTYTGNIGSETYTERMRVDSSGNVGINTTTPNKNVLNKALTVNSTTGYAGFEIAVANTITADFITNASNAFLTTRTAIPLVFQTNDTERMRIASDGNVGVGTNNPSNKLQVNGTLGVLDDNLQFRRTGQTTWNMTNFNSNLYFNNGSDRMIIDSSGNLLVGSTSRANGGWNGGYVQSVGYAARSGVGGSFSGNAFNLNWTGNLQAWVDTTNLGTIAFSSDYRIKRNVETQTAPALERVMALRPVTYQMTDYGDLFKASEEVKEGFIAHEVQEVIPSGADGIKDDENQIQSLRVDAILAVAVKAIQEQQAMIEELKTKVAALEAK
jgi:hypothetical protein